MAVIPASKFSQFARQLDAYTQRGEFTPLLKKSYQAFEGALKSPHKTLCDAFKAKFHVPIDLGNPPQPFSTCVMKYMMLFRRMFPSQKVEAQPYGFQVKNEKENPFVMQWNLMRDHIGKKDVLTSKLTEILLKRPSFDVVREELEILLDTGAKISPEAARSVLLDDDRRFFDLLLSRGYQPTLPDLDLVFQWAEGDKRAERAKTLVSAGVKVDASLAPHCYWNLNALELLVSLGYQLTSTDLKGVREGKTYANVLPFMRFFKDHGYLFTEEECIDFLTSQFLHGGRETTIALIEIICPGGLTSVLLHKMLGFTAWFIAYGYTPTFQDLEEAMRVHDQNAALAMTPIFKRALTIDEAVRVLSSSLTKSTTKELLRHTPMTQELFRAAFVSRTVDMGLVIKDTQIRDPLFQRASGSYEVTHDDIEFAVQQGVHTGLLRLFLHCWDACATKPLFRAVLKKGDVHYHLGILLEANYTVDAEDFRHACDIHCSEDTLSRLLNFGLVRHGKDQYRDYGYTGRSVYQSILHYDNAGYIPTQADLNYAREKGLPENVLKLIESHLNRKPFAVWHNRFGEKRTYFIQ